MSAEVPTWRKEENELEVLLQQHHNSHLQPKNSFHPHKTGLGLRTVDAFSNAPKHLDIAGTDEPNARLLTIQRKLNTNFSLVAKFLTRKFKELFITSKNLTAKRKIFVPITPASAETPNTVTSHLPGCNAAARSFYENKLVQKIKNRHFNSDSQLCCLLKQCISKSGKKRPGSSLEVAVEYVCTISNLTQGGKRIGSLAATTPQ